MGTPAETWVFEDALYALNGKSRFRTVRVFDAYSAEDQEKIRDQ